MSEEYRADGDDARNLRLSLVATLAGSGAVESYAWRSAFTAVPRHVFVPQIFIPGNAGSYEPLDGTDPTLRDEWLRHVYRDEICITQLDGNDDAWMVAVSKGSVQADRITCTSSQPSLMAAMLEELNARDNESVLEIGTGIGYNAALLCERLGSEQVTSVDIDPLLVHRARDALASLGYRPHLASVDGGDETLSSDKYSRIIATASFAEIPARWLKQTSEHGLILANLFRPLGGGILAASPCRMARVPDTSPPGWPLICPPAISTSLPPSRSTSDQ